MGAVFISLDIFSQFFREDLSLIFELLCMDKKTQNSVKAYPTQTGGKIERKKLLVMADGGLFLKEFVLLTGEVLSGNYSSTRKRILPCQGRYRYSL